MLRSIANQRSQSRFRDNVGLRQVSGVASVLHRVACAVFFVQGRCRSDRVSSRTRAAMNVLLRTTSASPTHTPPTSTSEVYACQFYAALLKKYADRRNTKYAADICGNAVQNCLKPTTPSRSTGVRTRGWCILQLLVTRWLR